MKDSDTDADVHTEMKKKELDEQHVQVKEPSHKLSLAKEILTWTFKYVISTLIGFIFGYAMEKAKVYEPIAIRQQMIFQKFIMLKMFLAAMCIATASVFIAANVFKVRYNKILSGGKDALKSKSAHTLIVGGLLIGVGMQISGSCPGMVLVQLGAGVPYAWITLIGCLVGALIHGLLSPYLSPSASNEFVSKALFDIIPIHANITRVVIVVLLALTVFLMEFFIPWTIEYSFNITTSNIFVLDAWPPYGKFVKFYLIVLLIVNFEFSG